LELTHLVVKISKFFKELISVEKPPTSISELEIWGFVIRSWETGATAGKGQYLE
jgi:hypothetical protein